MTISFLADEHVPSVFVNTLRSNDYHVMLVKETLGEGTSDAELLEYASENNFVLITHDKKDFGGKQGTEIEHAGIVIYTDPLFLRRSPEKAVHVLDRVFEHYPAEELTGNRVWLDQWRRSSLDQSDP